MTPDQILRSLGRTYIVDLVEAAQRLSDALEAEGSVLEAARDTARVYAYLVECTQDFERRIEEYKESDGTPAEICNHKGLRG